MYKPKFNHVLVEIDDKDAKWGNRDEDNLGGVAYREGTVIDTGEVFTTQEYPDLDVEEIASLISDLQGKKVMWNEGHEAGTVFEDNDKKYALIYWWDIIGEKV